MKRSSFSAEQLIAILNLQDSGEATTDVFREHGVYAVTFYTLPSPRHSGR